jgi:hypothetical protein
VSPLARNFWIRLRWMMLQQAPIQQALDSSNSALVVSLC